MKLLFLGTGASMGVPVIGCRCDVCLSSNPRHHRLRSSVLLTADGKKILIDPTPDFRQQALRANITHLDAVLITHAHADHINGLDDLRPLYLHAAQDLPVYLSESTHRIVARNFSHLVHEEFPGARRLHFHTFPNGFHSFECSGMNMRTVEYVQQGMPVTGFVVGDIAYVSDIQIYTEELVPALRGCQTLILSALRNSKSRSHLTLEQAIQLAQAIGPQRTFFTHIAHELNPEEALPQGMQLAYDGCSI